MRFDRFVGCRVIAHSVGLDGNVHQVSESRPEAVRHHRANGSGLHQPIERLPSRQPAMLYSCGTTNHNRLNTENTTMKTSARNHFSGEVTAIKSGAVNDEITLRVDGTTLVAVVTQESTKSLGLAVGAKASALIKASSVIVMVDCDPSKISTRNVLTGTVANVKPGAVNTEVTISAGGLQIAAIITNDSATRLGLATGTPASAVFKASSVIIAVE